MVGGGAEIPVVASPGAYVGDIGGWKLGIGDPKGPLRLWAPSPTAAASAQSRGAALTSIIGSRTVTAGDRLAAQVHQFGRKLAARRTVVVRTRNRPDPPRRSRTEVCSPAVDEKAGFALEGLPTGPAGWSYLTERGTGCSSLNQIFVRLPKRSKDGRQAIAVRDDTTHTSPVCVRPIRLSIFAHGEKRVD